MSFLDAWPAPHCCLYFARKLRAALLAVGWPSLTDRVQGGASDSITPALPTQPQSLPVEACAEACNVKIEVRPLNASFIFLEQERKCIQALNELPPQQLRQMLADHAFVSVRLSRRQPPPPLLVPLLCRSLLSFSPPVSPDHALSLAQYHFSVGANAGKLKAQPDLMLDFVAEVLEAALNDMRHWK